MQRQNQVNELFALPVNLEPVLYTDGIMIYSSETLKSKFVEAIKAFPSTEDIAPYIEKLIKDEKIIPCFMNKGVLKFLSYKFFTPKEEKGILGFYHLGQKKVFILVENNITFYGKGNDKAITLTLLHECMHLLADLKPSTYWKMFESELKAYYQALITNLFNLKSKADVSKLTKLLVLLEGAKMQKTGPLIKKYKQIVKDITTDTKLEEHEYDRVFSTYFEMIDLGFKDAQRLIYRIYAKDRDVINVIISLYKSYKIAFGVVNNITTPFQELFAPSEVLCVMSELKPSYSKIRKIFKVLA